MSKEAIVELIKEIGSQSIIINNFHNMCLNYEKQSNKLQQKNKELHQEKQYFKKQIEERITHINNINNIDNEYYIEYCSELKGLEWILTLLGDDK